jgi:hypothetical protein
MDIQKNLDSERTKLLFKAYSVAYNAAKTKQGVRFIISYLFAIVPLILIVKSEFKPFVSIVGSLWGLTAFFLTLYEKNKVKIAAKIQDQFDCDVFNIPTNDVLVGNVSEWDIDQYAKKYSYTVNLSSWYGSVAHIPRPLDVIISQRSNVIWDWRLRKQYFIYLVFFLIALFLTGVFIACYYKISVPDWINQIFLPSSSVFLLGIKELLEHFDNYTSKQKLETKIDTIISNHKIQNIPIDLTKLRQIQDVIFILRKCTALVPSWYYKLFQKSYDRKMQLEINKAFK